MSDFIRIRKADDGSYIITVSIETEKSYKELKYTAKSDKEVFTKLKEFVHKIKSESERDEYVKTFSKITQVMEE